MSDDTIFDDDKPINEQCGLEIPAWIEQDIDATTVDNVCQGGCNSGAYMPAVTYHTARETMNEHGDDVFDYITDQLGVLPTPPTDANWSSLACFYLSLAVELWASETQDWLKSVRS